MEPVHVQLNANDFRVSVINASHQTLQDVKVTAKVIKDVYKRQFYAHLALLVCRKVI